MQPQEKLGRASSRSSEAAGGGGQKMFPLTSIFQAAALFETSNSEFRATAGATLQRPLQWPQNYANVQRLLQGGLPRATATVRARFSWQPSCQSWRPMMKAYEYLATPPTDWCEVDLVHPLRKQVVSTCIPPPPTQKTKTKTVICVFKRSEKKDPFKTMGHMCHGHVWKPLQSLSTSSTCLHVQPT